ncbi:hypothetical protein [Ruania alba]|uniref:Uncharacterized protein n=1 Tax=Ruania alba TaxID=648782 RepID=A0A1H5N4M6_9MICO|nr:hypothetical protein [Ruania alba]SEE96552.1 hypothetical protein SAMN04488554_3937 [Ruania alba]
MRAEDIDPNLVSPGIGAFLAFLALALVVILIARSFTVHMRRIEARAAQDEAERGASGDEDSGDASSSGETEPQNGDQGPEERN